MITETEKNDLRCVRELSHSFGISMVFRQPEKLICRYEIILESHPDTAYLLRKTFFTDSSISTITCKVVKQLLRYEANRRRVTGFYPKPYRDKG